MLHKKPYLSSGATLSDCGAYRYELSRIWNHDKPLAVFIMLNPSTANITIDDPTITKICKISDFNGFGGIWVVNLFAYRATDPKELLNILDPIGPENLKHISATRSLPGASYVFAWGASKTAKQQSDKIAAMFPKAKALFINKDGSPKHPLYCKDTTKFIPFRSLLKVEIKPNTPDHFELTIRFGEKTLKTVLEKSQVRELIGILDNAIA